MNGTSFLKPDLVVTWPMHLDYPLWRQQLKDHRDRFKSVIIVFTNMNVGKDYRDFLIKAMDGNKVIFLHNYLTQGDWRNNSVNLALRNITSDWVFFTEQDFIFKPGLWDLVTEQMKEHKYIRAMVGDRVHPCCILVTRPLIEKTSKNFAVVKDMHDHFYVFADELKEEKAYTIPEAYWYHYGSMSQNMYFLLTGQKITYEEEEFRRYLKKCLEVKVPMHKDFINLFKGYLDE